MKVSTLAPSGLAIALLCASLLGSAQAALLDGLVAHWDFEEGSGTTSTDTVGGQVANLNNGASFGSGKYGSGLELDGANDYAGVSSFSLGPTSGLTASAWLNLDIHKTQHYLLDGRGDANYWLNIGPTGIQYPGNNPGNPPYTLNNWHHLLVSSDGSNTVIYMDGIAISSTVASVPVTATSFMNIGRRFNGVEYLDGTLDELAFWDRALSASEVSEVFNLQDGLSNAASSVPTAPSLALMLIVLGCMGHKKQLDQPRHHALPVDQG